MITKISVLVFILFCVVLFKLVGTVEPIPAGKGSRGGEPFTLILALMVNLAISTSTVL